MKLGCFIAMVTNAAATAEGYVPKRRSEQIKASPPDQWELRAQWVLLFSSLKCIYHGAFIKPISTERDRSTEGFVCWRDESAVRLALFFFDSFIEDNILYSNDGCSDVRSLLFNQSHSCSCGPPGLNSGLFNRLLGVCVILMDDSLLCCSVRSYNRQYVCEIAQSLTLSLFLNVTSQKRRR